VLSKNSHDEFWWTLCWWTFDLILLFGFLDVILLLIIWLSGIIFSITNTFLLLLIFNMYIYFFFTAMFPP